MSVASSHSGKATAIAHKRRGLSREAKVGVAAVAAVVAVRVLIGNLVVNEWEGWSAFVPNAIAAALEGIVLGGLVFGLLVRPLARSRSQRLGVGASIVGVLGVLSLAIPYSAPQVIVGAAAVALGIAAVDRPDVRSRSRRLARVGIVLGCLTILAWVSFAAFTIATGDWPISAG